LPPSSVGRVVEALVQLRELLDETRRRAEDAIAPLPRRCATSRGWSPPRRLRCQIGCCTDKLHQTINYTMFAV
jgi:hypothetical protein